MPEIPAFISQWLLHYGEIALFFSLALGILGLPIPDETILAFAGYLIAKGKLSLPLTMVTSFLGSVVGITLSYLLGYYLGHFLLEKFGKRVGLTEEKIQKVQAWFDRIGKWTLFIGYFIPGVRHLTGYVAGSMRLHFLYFALFAYGGALLWSQTFIFLGYYFSNTWEAAVSVALNYIWIGAIILLSILFIYILKVIYMKRKNKDY